MIAIGADHAGVRLKSQIAAFLRERGEIVSDLGTHDETSTDYPDYAEKVGREVAAGRAERGILICGTGIGISIAANKIDGIRAALCGDTLSARMSREHNDANILCLGARVLGDGLAMDIVAAWMDASYAGGRHQRRIDKIAALESAPVAR
ncbi:MAG: ribose 5-phosphate isomerase B [Chloroflexi bacterium]|nr:ribose 5-phosphate isomerase B [Chloroflexota bacterium]